MSAQRQAHRLLELEKASRPALHPVQLLSSGNKTLFIGVKAAVAFT
jgi:hypothetical protein